MATFTFDYINKRITVDAPDTTVTGQEIVNAIRTEEDALANLTKDDGWWILDAGGKLGVGGGAINMNFYF